MRKEIADQWVAALRSGEYQQGRGRLCTVLDDGSENYCCLGVLCELAVKEGVIEPKHIDSNDSNGGDRFGRYEGHASHLPFNVEAWAFMRSNTGYRYGRGAALDRLNDGGVASTRIEPHTFAEIADIIEQEWEQL